MDPSGANGSWMLRRETDDTAIVDYFDTLPSGPIKKFNPSSSRRFSIQAGTFDLLPVEIVHAIFENMDLFSLHLVGCTSIQMRLLVESMPAYRDLSTFAPATLAVLKRTGLIGMHNITKVHHAFLHNKCSTCNRSTLWLYLPTCERSCTRCLCNEKCLRMVPATSGPLWFGLTQKEARHIPRLSCLPGAYEFRVRTKPLLLLSAKHLEELAISKYGDLETMEFEMELKYVAKSIEYAGGFDLKRGILGRPPVRLLRHRPDRYRFMGVTRMPVKVESGV